MFTVAVVIMPIALITWAIEFAMTIPNRWNERKQMSMFRRERSVFR